MVRIFVGNLGTHYNEAVLRTVFEAYGTVEDVNVSNNYAFVLMTDDAEAHQAISSLSYTSWFLRPLFVPSASKRAA